MGTFDFEFKHLENKEHEYWRRFDAILFRIPVPRFIHTPDAQIVEIR